MVPFRSNNLLQELTSIDKMHTGSLFFFGGSQHVEKKNQVEKELEMAGFLVWDGSVAEPLISLIIHNYN